MLNTHRTISVLCLLATTACATASGGRATPARVAEAESFARDAIANERSISPDSLPSHTLGITPLRINATDTSLAPLSYGLADLLMTDLARSASVRVVDRLRLDAILRELQLVSSGRVDPATAPRVGRLLQARRLVLGSLTQQPNGQIGIDAQVADVATSEIRSAVSARASLDDILAAEKELAFKIFAELGVTLTPAERVLVEQRATQNLAALLAYSRGVRFEVEGQYDAAAAEYQNALRLDPSFSLAGARLGSSQLGGSSLARVATAAAARVNTSLVEQVAQPGGPADPAFPARTVTIVVTITTPP
jgi:TolB-like protein